MSESNLEEQLNQTGAIAADVLLRITALERLLVKRGLIEENELLASLSEAGNELFEQLKQVLSTKEQE